MFSLLLLVFVALGLVTMFAPPLFLPALIVAVVILFIAAAHRCFCYAPNRYFWHRPKW